MKRGLVIILVVITLGLFSAVFASSNIDFVSPTPENGSIQNASSIYVNISSSSTSGDHYTFVNFNNSIVGWWMLNDTSDDEFGMNNGVWFGGEAYSSGMFGDAGAFNGSNYINITDDPSLDFGLNDFSYSFWMKANTVASGVPISHGFNPEFNLDGGILYFYFTTSGQCGLLASSDVLSADSWYHVVVTRRNNETDGNGYLYINGNLESQSVANCNVSDTDPFFISRNHDGFYFNGSIDDVLIFNRSLSASEISSLYNATAPSPSFFNFCAN